MCGSIRRHGFKSELSVKDISRPFGHLIPTADGVEKAGVASRHPGDPCS